MTDPRIAVICRTMGWNDDCGPDEAGILLDALDIHAAAELARQREGCVKVRVWVTYDHVNGWGVCREGNTTVPIFGFISAWVRPPVPQEIAGEVEHD